MGIFILGFFYGFPNINLSIVRGFFCQKQWDFYVEVVMVGFFEHIHFSMINLNVWGCIGVCAFFLYIRNKSKILEKQVNLLRYNHNIL